MGINTFVFVVLMVCLLNVEKKKNSIPKTVLWIGRGVHTEMQDLINGWHKMLYDEKELTHFLCFNFFLLFQYIKFDIAVFFKNRYSFTLLFNLIMNRSHCCLFNLYMWYCCWFRDVCFIITAYCFAKRV